MNYQHLPKRSGKQQTYRDPRLVRSRPPTTKNKETAGKNWDDQVYDSICCMQQKHIRQVSRRYGTYITCYHLLGLGEQTKKKRACTIKSANIYRSYNIRTEQSVSLLSGKQRNQNEAKQQRRGFIPTAKKHERDGKTCRYASFNTGTIGRLNTKNVFVSFLSSTSLLLRSSSRWPLYKIVLPTSAVSSTNVG